MRGRLARALLGGAVLVFGAAGCKHQKPPAMTRVWLGTYHGCATVKGGGLECWGANDVGQLGDGTRNQSTFPVRATLASGVPSELAIGARHTCGVFAEGHVQCWGDASKQQLAVPPGVVATAIAAGGDHTCVLDAGGLLRCWGDGNADGKAPAALSGKATSIAVGLGRVCAAFADAVRCAGADEHGQSAGQAPVLAGATIKGLAAGGAHTCALLEDGSVSCWGKNDLGQLGDGSTSDARAPTPVHALPPAVEIRAGANHTCARLRNNTVACWGDNRAHQLANGTTTSSSRPLPLQGLVGAFELALGGDSACARLDEGGARCWGGNAAGQLGDGTIADHDVPMPVRSPQH